MEFSLTSEQQEFSDNLRRWVDAEIPKDYLREIEAREDEYPVELFDKLTAGGYHAVSVPREFGGQGGRPGDTTASGTGAVPIYGRTDPRMTDLGLGFDVVRGGELGGTVRD